MYQALIIDDEPHVAIAIHELADWENYQITTVHTATNGKQALELFHSYHPELIFLDYQMPKMDGREFLIEVSKDPLFSNSKCIIISGYEDFSFARFGLKVGVTDYLLKPIVGIELNTAIEKAMASYQIKPASSRSTLSPDEVSKQIKQYLDDHYCEEIKLSIFTKQYFYSREYLSKSFKKNYNLGIYEYVLQKRMERAKQLLAIPSLKIQEISDILGYSNNNYFSKAFKSHYNITPSEYRDSL